MKQTKYQYWSKWRHCWCDFKQTPNAEHLAHMRRFFYQIRIVEL